MSRPKPTQRPATGAQGPDAGGELPRDDAVELELSDEAAEVLRRLEAERDEALAGRMRALADYSNYQRRAAENESRALVTGAARLARSIIPVLDNFDLALAQGGKPISVEQLSAGVRLVRDELFKALEAHGVARIAPEVGSEFDPNRHEAMYRQAAEGLAANAIVSVLQPGYVLGDLVLRPAKVAVAEEHEEEPADERTM